MNVHVTLNDYKYINSDKKLKEKKDFLIKITKIFLKIE